MNVNIYEHDNEPVGINDLADDVTFWSDRSDRTLGWAIDGQIVGDFIHETAEQLVTEIVDESYAAAKSDRQFAQRLTDGYAPDPGLEKFLEKKAATDTAVAAIGRRIEEERRQ